MRMSLTIASLLLLLQSAAAQAPPPPPTCEQTLGTLYQGLAQEQLVPAAEEWSQQLTALATQVRLDRTTYDMKDQQARLAERNIAQLLEHVRQLRLQQQTLQAENDRLKAQHPPAN